MPEQENTEQTKKDTDELPEKFKGKTAAEIARSYVELERQSGSMSEEVGRLRDTVADLSARIPETPAETQPTDDEEAQWESLGSELITNPGAAARKIVTMAEERAARRAVSHTTEQSVAAQQVEAYIRNNPDLEDARDVFSVIGAQLYRQYAGKKSFGEILEMTTRETRKWVGSFDQRRAERKKADAARRKAAITTSGGTAREQIAEEEEETGSERKPRLSSEQEAIAQEIENLRGFRKDRMLPPHAKAAKK